MTVQADLSGMIKVFSITPSLSELEHDKCPGCGGTVAFRAIVEAVEKVRGDARVVRVKDVGCGEGGGSNFDQHMALHGRATSVATGIKRIRPDALVFTTQGDGGTLNEGLQEVVHAALRGENITCFLFNNACFGDTGGQATVASLPGQRTKTTPVGSPLERPEPLLLGEMIAPFKGVAYVARAAASSPANIMRGRRYAERALQLQKQGAGFTLVEFLNMCPSGWAMTPVESAGWIENTMTQYYPLGELKGGA